MRFGASFEKFDWRCAEARHHVGPPSWPSIQQSNTPDFISTMNGSRMLHGEDEISSVKLSNGRPGWAWHSVVHPSHSTGPYKIIYYVVIHWELIFFFFWTATKSVLVSFSVASWSARLLGFNIWTQKHTKSNPATPLLPGPTQFILLPSKNLRKPTGCTDSHTGPFLVFAIFVSLEVDFNSMHVEKNTITKPKVLKLVLLFIYIFKLKC